MSCKLDECKPLIGGGGEEAAKLPTGAGADPRFGNGSTPAGLPKPLYGYGLAPGVRQGLTLVHLAAEPELFLTQTSPQTTPNTPEHHLNIP